MLTHGPVPLDRISPNSPQPVRSAADVASIEKIPLVERLACHDTYNALKLGAAIEPNAPAIQFLPNADPNDEPLVISHREFIELITRSANLFGDLDSSGEPVISLLLPLLPQSFYALFGAEAAGCANPVNPLLAPHQIAEILKAAGTTVLVTIGPTPDSDIWQKVAGIHTQLPKLKSVVQIGGERQPDTIDFDTQLMSYPSDVLTIDRKLTADHTAAYFHTGGTTGTPKLVRHTHLNQVYQAWLLNSAMPAPAQDTLLFGLPLFHVGGALTQALASFTRGASVVVLSASGWRHPNAVKNVWRLVERFKPSNFGAVPTVLAAAASVPVDDADISSLNFSSGGGSAIPVAIGNALQELTNKPVYEVYGMTETASVHTFAYPEREVRLGSAGHAAPYSAVHIVKVDGEGNYLEDCATNEIGLIAMSGPGTFSGYLNSEHNENAFIAPGKVNSGDLGRIDAEGYLWITGRAKDLIIRGGHNIDPAGVEDLLFGHPDVVLAAMVGQPDSYAGEMPIVFAQLGTSADAAKQAEIKKRLLKHVRENTPERAAVPVDIVFMDPLPLTAVGKVFKPALRWIAAQRVFAEELKEIAAQHPSISIDVQVGAHGTHGSLAIISVGGASNGQQSVLNNQIDHKLASFVLAHETVFTG